MEVGNEFPELMTLGQAAKYGKVTRQAYYVALKQGRLKATQIKRKWYVTKEDLDEYRGNKYNRDLRKQDGEFVFDMEKGHFSVPQICKILSASLKRPYAINHLYYLVRTGQIKAFRKGYAWVIHKDEAIALLEKEMGHQKEQMRMI